jgi:hypothetical protein
MIKQTVSYGVWTINRHDDNKLEILKNGQLCEKNTPALREIAAELGYEIDPEWRTSQLGRNVLKAMQNAAENGGQSTTNNTEEKTETPIETSSNSTATIEEKTIEESKVETNSSQPDYKSMSDEEIYRLCVANDIDAIEYLSNKCCKSRVYGMKFRNNIKTLPDFDTFLANIEQVGGTADMPKNRNALELYANCLYSGKDKLDALKILIDKKLLPYCTYVLEKYPVELEEKIKELKQNGGKPAKLYYIQGALCWHLVLNKKDAIAAKILYRLYRYYTDDLYDYYCHRFKHEKAKSYIGDGIALFLADQAMQHSSSDSETFIWAEKVLGEAYSKECIQCYQSGKYEQIQGMFGDHILNVEGAVETLIKERDDLKIKYQLFKEKYSEQYLQNNEVVRNYNELVDRYNELVRTIKEERADYNKLVDRFQSTLESASSSSSSSSDDDTVRVRVNFTTDNKWWNAIRGGAQTISMPKSEYKSLLKGSMKARIAFVHDKFNVPSSYKVSDVSISLA